MKKDKFRYICKLLIVAICLLLGDFSPAAERKLAEPGYYYISTEGLSVTPQLAQAVCDPAAERGWALQALSDALRNGSASRIMSFSAGAMYSKGKKSSDYNSVGNFSYTCISAEITQYFITGYESVSGYALPVVKNNFQQRLRYGLDVADNFYMPEITTDMLLLKKPVKSIDTAAGEIQQPSFIPYLMFHRNDHQLKEGVNFICGNGIGINRVAVAIVYVKRFKLDTVVPLPVGTVLRFTLVETTEGALQNLKSQAADFPYLSREQQSQLAANSVMLKSIQRTLAVDGSKPQTATVQFLGGYTVDKKEGDHHIAAPVNKVMGLAEKLELDSIVGDGTLSFDFAVYGNVSRELMQTKAGPVELPSVTRLSVGGRCPVKPGDIMVLATTSEPLDCGSMGMEPVFSDVDPGVFKKFSADADDNSDDTASAADADSDTAGREIPRRLVLMLEVLK